jgi:hypothetical protein
MSSATDTMATDTAVIPRVTPFFRCVDYDGNALTDLAQVELFLETDPVLGGEFWTNPADAHFVITQKGRMTNLEMDHWGFLVSLPVSAPLALDPWSTMQVRLPAYSIKLRRTWR